MNMKLDRSNIENLMALTSLQQGMLFHYISDVQSRVYHEQLRLRVKGDIKLDLLQKSWQLVVENNEMLRTVFRWKGIDKPVQIVLKKHEIPIQYIDFSDEVDKHKLMKNIELKDLNNRIDITKETLRIYLCKLDEHIHEMIISNHHILYDGWSNGIILKELMEVYNCLYENRGIEKKNKLKFSEFIKYINIFNKEDEKKYWTSYLENLANKDDFLGCKKKGCYKQISHKMDNIKANKIKDFAKANRVLLSSILYGAWGVLLQKFNNSNEVLFGTTVSGRTENIKSIDSMVGLFINTIPLRVKSEGSKKFIELVHELDKVLNERKEFENTSLVDIKNYCGLKNNEQFFNSIVVIENYPLDLSLNKENILFVENFSIIEQTNFNMSLEILTFDGIEFKFNFNSLAIDESIVKKLGNYLEKIMDTLSNNIRLEEIDLLLDEERNQILFEFNNIKVNYPEDKAVQELFEEQVAKTPNNIAVIFQNTELTYKELNQRANSLARVLRNKGIKADSIVGIMVERSLEMVIGIMAVIKSGAAYLPIDPSYPKERIEYMLKDSESKVLLSKNALVETIGFDGEIIDLLSEELFNEVSNNLEKINNSTNLAYVMYTSGTTSNPKGVMLEHINLNNFIKCFNSHFNKGFDSSDRVLSLTNYVFDVSVCEFFVSLLNGATLIINDKHRTFNPEEISKLIVDNKITFTYIPPSLLQNVYEELKKYKNSIKLNKLLVGVEAIRGEILNKFYDLNENIEIVNGYGPTEATICSTFYKVNRNEDENKAIPIGKAIGNTNIYILDKLLKIVPIGAVGEIFIAGTAVGRGYLNRPELTAEKFVDNPFEICGRMYKTGDLARWLPNGNIEFLGRADYQVKVRGFRVEPGEIESKLLANEDIKEAVVVGKKDDTGSKYLSAYIVAERKLSAGELRGYLSKMLPEYMIPSYFIQLEKLPLTPNGKVDRKSLPEPNFDETLTGYEAPRNEIEETLVKIWSEVLGIKRIGITDNFFELGGHSLKATVLMSKIHKEFNKEIPLNELFKSPTIKELSVVIGYKEQNLYSSIERIEEKEYYGASSAQKRMYMLQEFDKDSTAYNMAIVYELQGTIDKNKIEEIFEELVIRHEALRSSFEMIEGQIVQKLCNSYKFKLVEREENDDIESVASKFIRPFKLEKAPLFRTELVKNQEKTYLLIDMHHIISDGVSMGILIKEFIELYNGQALEPLRLQYKDFAAWQNSLLNSEEMKKQKEYWIGRFKDELPVLNMPTDYIRPAIQKFDGDSINFIINKDMTAEIKKMARETGSTINMVILSALNILLSKYSGQEDIIIGTPIAGRSHADLEKIMGMFVNTLAMRNYPEGEKSYEEFLKEVKENALKAYENQDYQFEELVDNLNIKRDISRNPIFDVMFSMQNIDEDIETAELKFKKYENSTKIAKFDITLSAYENKECILLNYEYSTNLFKKETIERMAEHFYTVLKKIIANRNIKINEIEIVGEEEKYKLFNEFNDTYVDYPKHKTFHELFEEQVEKTPNNIAVVFKDKQLTYRELNNKSNQLARLLRRKGVKPESIVGIMVERSLEMIIGIVGIIKSGAAYLPIDPEYPEERIKYMLEDSKANIFITNKHLINKIEFNGELIDIEDSEIYVEDALNLENIAQSNNLVYVIYTSGTTGNPKGVMIEHKNLINAAYAWKRHYKLNEFDVRLLQIASMSFDVFAGDLCRSLLNGGTMYVINNDMKLNMGRVYEIITKYHINIFESTPSYVITFINYINENNLDISNINILILGSDNCPLNEYKNILDKYGKYMRVINSYGVTEATIDSSYYEEELSNICNLSNTPIGKPLNNTQFYILNNKLITQPIGVYGELFIGGDGISRGYLGKEKLTSEKFIGNPFNEGQTMYRTGDLARWLSDGNIEFLGRIDNQVKIRGYRIELGEIENQILSYGNIKEVVVIDREYESGNKFLCAYIVCEKELEVSKIKEYLGEKLPDYMVPLYFMEMEKIPLTPNGKVDRKALPELDYEKDILQQYEAPRNEIERKLVDLWQETLGISKVGINDNFFDLGGHSLKATVLVSKIHKELNIEVPIKEIFKRATIKGLSEYISSNERSVYSSIKPVEIKEYYEASSAQKRMYMLQQFDQNSTSYNIYGLYELEGEINIEKIERTFRKIVVRHEGLRTYFETLNNEVVQKIDENYNFEMVIRKENQDIESILRNFVKPFDLNKAPLFRVELVESKEKIYLLIDMHHIISDSISMSILIKEFIALYNGQELKIPKIQYKDFSEWQNNLQSLERMNKEKDYWINRFNDEIPVLNLPYDYERPVIKSFEGDTIKFEIDEEITKKLVEISKETETTMHMVLVSAFNILLSKYSGQKDIVIGTPIAGRMHVDLNDVIGMFVNTLALRNKPESEKTYIEFLEELKENSLKAYENQNYQFEKLVEELEIKRDISRNPIFDVMFNMIDTVEEKNIELNGMKLKQYSVDEKVSKFDLMLTAMKVDAKIEFDLVYCTKLFKRESVELMVVHLKNILEQIINNKNEKIKNICIGTEEQIKLIENQIDEEDYEIDFNF